jgi:hypothetical protein
MALRRQDRAEADTGLRADGYIAAPPEAAFSGPLDVVAKALWCPTSRRPPLLTSGPEKTVRWVFNIEIWY